MDTLQHYNRDYSPYIPPLSKEEIPAAKRVILEMIQLSQSTLKGNPSTYNKRIADYWNDRKKALEAF